MEPSGFFLASLAMALKDIRSLSAKLPMLAIAEVRESAMIAPACGSRPSPLTANSTMAMVFLDAGDSAAKVCPVRPSTSNRWLTKTTAPKILIKFSCCIKLPQPDSSACWRYKSLNTISDGAFWIKAAIPATGINPADTGRASAVP